jgi:hypothetical protein
MWLGDHLSLASRSSPGSIPSVRSAPGGILVTDGREAEAKVIGKIA